MVVDRLCQDKFSTADYGELITPSSYLFATRLPWLIIRDDDDDDDDGNTTTTAADLRAVTRSLLQHMVHDDIIELHI